MNTLLKEEYVKTALYAYPNLQRTIMQYQDLVYTKAINSHRTPDHTFEQCANIAEIQYQIQTLKELQGVMDRMTKRLDSKTNAILGYLYYKTIPTDKLESLYGISHKKISGKSRKAILNKVAYEIAVRGIGDDWFEKEGFRVPFLKYAHGQVLRIDEKNKSRHNAKMATIAAKAAVVGV